MGDLKLELLLEWLAQNDVSWNPELSIEHVQPPESEDEEVMDYALTSIGVFSRGFLSANQIVACIPLHALLSSRTSSLNFLPPREMPSHLLLAAHLMHEMLSGKASRWHGYIQSLPTAQDLCLPRSWPPHAASWLKETELGHLVAAESVQTERAWEEQVRHALNGNCQVYTQAPTLALYEDAVGLVTSRAFVVDTYHGLSMVPLADVYAPFPEHRMAADVTDSFNHASSPHVQLQTDDIVCPVCGSFDACLHDDDESMPKFRGSADSSGNVEMILLRDVDGPCEVFNTYTASQPEPNAVLLARYGFSLPANPADIVAFPELDGAAAEVPPAHLQHLIRESKRAYIDADGLISSKMWAALRSSDHIRAKLKDRLAATHRSDLGITELLELYDAAQDRALRLALGNIVNERLLLQTCEANWTEVDRPD